MPKANDLFNQYIRSMNLSLSDRQKRLEEMCNCHHVFFLLKADDYGDTIECLKCGLTNKDKGLYKKCIVYLKKGFATTSHPPNIFYFLKRRIFILQVA